MDLQANMIYQEDLTALTPERVMKFIKHHNDNQRPRLERLDTYYRGENYDITHPASRRIDDGKADHRAVHSFGKYIADFQTAYSVGNPIGVKLPSEDKRFTTITQRNDIDALNYDLFLDATRYGRAYEYIYYGEDGIEHCVRLDPLDTFVIYSLDVDPRPIMAVRYHNIQLVDKDDSLVTRVVPETWTATEYKRYAPVQIGNSMTLAETRTIPVFPVVEYDNNRFRLGDFEHVVSLIDLYDAAQSDTANYMTDLNDALLVISGDIDALFNGSTLLSGVDPTDPDAMKRLAKDKLELIKEQKSANMLLLKSGFGATGQQTSVDAKYINKEYDVNGAEAYKKRIAEDIHKFSHTPDLTDSNFASNTSGVAMKYKLLGTVELAAIKRRMFEKSLYQRYTIIAALEAQAHKGWHTDPNELQFTFKDNLPADDVAQIQALQSAGAVLPQQYLYQFLPGITDVQDVLDMMAEQRAETGAGDYNGQFDEAPSGQASEETPGNSEGDDASD